MRPAIALGLVICVHLAGQSSAHLGRELDQWQADLEAPGQVVRLLAARAIGEMAIADHEGAEEALFAALGHEDGSVRFWAATAAAHLPDLDESRLGSLRKALADEVPEVRVQAALGLVGQGEVGDALSVLAEAMRHRNRGVRLHAVHAADAIGEAAAPIAEDLRVAMDDDFDYVQRVARHALWTLGERPCPYRECN